MHTILPHAKNPALREKAREIPQSDMTSARIRALIADMKKLLAKEKFGVALAASQVGEPLRLFIVSGAALRKHEEAIADVETASEATLLNSRGDASDTTHAQDAVYINPVMTKLSRAKTEKHEGCLSIRGTWGEVPRAEKATIRAFDEDGRAFTRGASGFLAHIFQHEMDHLEGVLYIDKATSLYDEDAEHEE